MIWGEFVLRASDAESPWDVRMGYATLPMPEEESVASMHILVEPVGVPDLDAERVRLALSGEEVKVGLVLSSPEGPNPPSLLERFFGLWDEEIGLERPTPVDPYPSGYNPPTPIELTPMQLSYFRRRFISKTPLSPLYGQEGGYFWETVLLLNSGPEQPQDPDVETLYRQEWVSGLICPFCLHSDFSAVEAVSVRPPDARALGFEPTELLALLCPGCSRCIEAMPSPKGLQGPG